MSVVLSLEDFKAALPPKLKLAIGTDVHEKINDLLNNPDMCETYRENLLSYAHVMNEGRFKVANYVDAVKYCSHKMMVKTNIDSFSMTFPEKIKRWADQGVESKDIASYVSAYHKSKLVQLILEQAVIPLWLLNQDAAQKAINVLADLMISASSDKVKSDSASALLTHLKQPETKKIELDIGIKEGSAITALRDAQMELARLQRENVENGKSTLKEIANSSIIIEGEVVHE
jgi:hypothetical protein